MHIYIYILINKTNYGCLKKNSIFGLDAYYLFEISLAIIIFIYVKLILDDLNNCCINMGNKNTLLCFEFYLINNVFKIILNLRILL